METNTVNLNQMHELAKQIKTAFPVEKIELFGDTDFTIYFNQTVTDKPAHVKAVHDLIKPHMENYGDKEEQYSFTFKQDRELIDILHFNDPGSAYHIRMNLFGREEEFRIQDVMGATGDFTIFNSDFQQVGYLSAVGIPVDGPPENSPGEESEGEFYDDVYPDFNRPEIWQVSPETLKPHLNEILEKVLIEINKNYIPNHLDVNDPEDLSFWAEQFEISEDDLRNAALAAGDSIDDITAYLQK
jgi:hypothetical protein